VGASFSDFSAVKPNSKGNSQMQCLTCIIHKP
jgi:hypothetical protein